MYIIITSLKGEHPMVPKGFGPEPEVSSEHNVVAPMKI